jgi:hypothetical protein
MPQLGFRRRHRFGCMSHVAEDESGEKRKCRERDHHKRHDAINDLLAWSFCGPGETGKCSSLFVRELKDMIAVGLRRPVYFAKVPQFKLARDVLQRLGVDQLHAQHDWDLCIGSDSARWRQFDGADNGDGPRRMRGRSSGPHDIQNFAQLQLDEAKPACIAGLRIRHEGHEAILTRRGENQVVAKKGA